MNKCKSYLVTIDDDKFYLVENQPESWFRQESIYARSRTEDGVIIYVDGLDGYREWCGLHVTTKKQIDFIKTFEKASCVLETIGDIITFNDIKIELVELPTIDINKSIEYGEWNRHDCLCIYVNNKTVTQDGDVYRSKDGITEVQSCDPYAYVGKALTSLLRVVYCDDTIDINACLTKKTNEHEEQYTTFDVSIVARSVDIIEDILSKHFSLPKVKGKINKLEDVVVDGKTAIKTIVSFYDCFFDDEYMYEQINIKKVLPS